MLNLILAAFILGIVIGYYIGMVMYAAFHFVFKIWLSRKT